MYKSILAFLLTIISFNLLAQTNESQEIKNKLSKIDPSFVEYDVEDANFNNLYRVSKGSEILYTDKNVTYLIFGKVVKVDKNNFLSSIEEEKIKNEKLDILNKYDKTEFVKYAAKGEKKISIYVFSDITCPICKRFHQYVDILNENGIEINYIPFPRNGLTDTKTVQSLKKIYCSANPQEEFTLAFNKPTEYLNNTKVEETICEKAFNINKFYNYADELKIIGTPAIFTENGAYISGFTDIQTLTKKLKYEIDYKKNKQVK